MGDGLRKCLDLAPGTACRTCRCLMYGYFGDSVYVNGEKCWTALAFFFLSLPPVEGQSAQSGCGVA